MSLLIAILFSAVFYFLTQEFEAHILPLIEQKHQQLAQLGWLVLSYTLPFACSVLLNAPTYQ